jgi:hypothetical protein
LEVAQWLYDTYTRISTNCDLNLTKAIDYDLDLTKAFELACANDHLAVAQWLHNTYTHIGIHYNLTYTFNSACANDHVAVAQWMLQISPALKHHNNIAHLFNNGQISCTIARLLLQANPELIGYIDIDTMMIAMRRGYNNINSIITTRCHLNQLDTVQWLCSLLQPSYSLIHCLWHVKQYCISPPYTPPLIKDKATVYYMA